MIENNYNPNMSKILKCLGDNRSGPSAGVNLQDLTAVLIRESDSSLKEKQFLEQELNDCFKVPGVCSAEQYLNNFNSIICSSKVALNKVVCAISEFFTEPLCSESSGTNASSSKSDSIDGNNIFFIAAGSLLFIIAMTLIIKHVFIDSKKCPLKLQSRSEHLLNSAESGNEMYDNTEMK